MSVDTPEHTDTLREAGTIPEHIKESSGSTPDVTAAATIHDTLAVLNVTLGPEMMASPGAIRTSTGDNVENAFGQTSVAMGEQDSGTLGGIRVEKQKEDLSLAEVQKRLAERTQQLQDLLGVVGEKHLQGMGMSAIVAEEKLRYPAFAEDELVAIIHQYELVKGHDDLQNALRVGAPKVRNYTGESVRVFAMRFIGQGTYGTVKDAYLLKDGAFVPAVVKEPNAWEVDENDPEASGKKEQNDLLKKSYAIEAMNARLYLGEGIPHVVKPLLVSIPTQDHPLPVIAYEKITDREGHTRNFASLVNDYTVPASKKFMALASVVDGLAGLSSRGLVHFDVKPENLALSNADPKNLQSPTTAALIDPGSITSVKEQVAINLSTDPNVPSKIYKATQLGARLEWSIGYTPKYLDLHALDQAMKQGKDMRVADRMAMGRVIKETLIYSNLLAADTELGPIHDYTHWLSLSPDQFPPASVKGMIALANELEDITSDKPQRDLDVIANEMRALAVKLQEDVDPLHRQIADKMQFSLKATL